MDIICPECGELNSVDDDFCRQCQAPLHSASEGSNLQSSPTTASPTSGEEGTHPMDSAGFPPDDSQGSPEETPLPDWLTQFYNNGEPDEIPSAQADLEPTEAAQLAEAASPTETRAPSEPVPEQLLAEEAPAATEPEEPAEKLEGAPEEAHAPESVVEQPEQPIESMEYYQSWLIEEKAKEAKAASAEPEPASSKPEEPPPREMPEWLKAMQAGSAIESSGAPEETADEGAEKSGPLAGLVGALPAEMDIIQSFKPSAYILKLRATDAQQTNAALLRQLIQMEGKPKPVTAPPPRRSQMLLRVVVTFVLFAAVMYALLTDTSALSPSMIADTAVVANQVVEGAPPDKPVLIAVDYSPAYTSEIGASLSAVLSRLLARGCYPVFISTNPTGPVQTQVLIEQLQSQTSTAQLPAHTNLGYLSGQVMGIRTFASDPRLTLPFEILSEPAWHIPQLSGVRTIADFGMVIVATENPETATNWIEQAHPLMGGTPLLMLVSAQIEPVIRPYYDASPRQVQGIIAGLVNAVQYETISGQTWAAHSLWSPVAFSLSIAVLLILLVLFVDSIFSIEAKSRHKRKQEARK